MGLCKCPKRKTTSHFCFHHCVNVCEHCIVNNHTTCVVKSYTTWLKESSNNISSVSTSSACAVCQKQFVSTLKEIDHNSTNDNDSNSNINTAIRLLCYHIVHARCLSVYVKKQLKNGDILKCPSCARPLWISQQDLDDISEVNIHELSPVSLQLYKYLLGCDTWWSKILITNGNMKDIEQHFLDEVDYDVESLQLFENESTSEMNPQLISVPDNIPSLSETFSIQNDKTSFCNFDITNIKPHQPIHHRIFNNNYGIDSPQEKHSLSVNMTIVQNSDLSNRHMLSATTSLLSNNDDLNYDAGQTDPSGKYRIKKFNNQYWSLSFQRLLQYLFYGTNNRTENNNTRIIITIIVCILIISVLLFAITNYTSSNNEPIDNNSIDYGGDIDREN